MLPTPAAAAADGRRFQYCRQVTAASVADDTNAQTYQEAYSEPPGSDAQLVVLGVTIGVVAVIFGMLGFVCGVCRSRKRAAVGASGVTTAAMPTAAVMGTAVHTPPMGIQVTAIEQQQQQQQQVPLAVPVSQMQPVPASGVSVPVGVAIVP